jgi:hypothetical protein
MAKFKSPGLLWKELARAQDDFVTADIDKLADIEATAAEVDILDGVTATTAEVEKLATVTASAAELNVTDNIPADVTFVPASAAANISEVTITVVDAAGSAIAAAFSLDVWLSDAATGIGLTGTAASGTVAVKTASGEDRETVTSKKHLRVQTLVSGIYILEITDTAKTGYFPSAIVPGTGATAVGSALVTGDYG